MTKAIIKAVRDAMLAHTTLTTALGGNYIYFSEIMQTNQIPSITMRINTESSYKRVGYNASKKRDNSATLQCDIWSKSSRQQTYEIADILEALLMGENVTNTRCWTKTSDSDQYEADTEIYHKALRFTFDYTITDS